jgi:polysaccharide deacetylase family protein (PEP-CTERM system associated)
MSDYRISNALTIDVEDYFHVNAFKNYINADQWHNYPVRVEDNTLSILDMLDEFSVKATFFVLGWVADKCPKIVRTMRERGHEIACHGYAHELVYEIGPKKFQEDIRRSKALLEDISGTGVYGYRAPTYSITKDSLWALDILIEEGFLYDSSIFPIYHDTYGIPDSNRFYHVMKRPFGTITEFPLSTFQFGIGGFKYRMPVAGGGYLRLFPEWILRKSIHYINTSEGQPVVIYFHPWEIDHEQPRIQAGFRSRFRHYINLDKTVNRIRNLLLSFKFAPMKEVLDI